MGRKPWVGGNWKCNGSVDSLEALCSALNDKAEFTENQCDVVICPSPIHIALVKSRLNKEFRVASQNCSKTGNGAYTGEVSVEQIRDFGLEWTLVGHSERRQYYGEADDVVAAKVEMCQKGGLNAAVCIGELLSEREAGETLKVCKRQVEAFVPKITDWSKIVIAYEPVWAIGTGKVATPAEAQEAHEEIRKLITEKVDEKTATALRIVYGGSVNEKNCDELYRQVDIDGFLVGGASLKPSFSEIIGCAVQTKK